jgi:SAM-dependent methyltransferase
MSGSRLESVWYGRDPGLLDAMLDFYAPDALVVIDVCCNAKRMWKGTRWAKFVTYYDIDPSVSPDAVCDWGHLPCATGSVDVLVYDPPHLPVAGISAHSTVGYAARYGLARSVKADNISGLFADFLVEARRVLRPNGIILAKIKDYVHNHAYQWNLEAYNAASRTAGRIPCDLVIKRDPVGGNLKSGRWVRQAHARNTHCLWVVTRNGKCDPGARR